jgi:hypothetical protein
LRSVKGNREGDRYGNLWGGGAWAPGSTGKGVCKGLRRFKTLIKHPPPFLIQNICQQGLLSPWPGLVDRTGRIKSRQNGSFQPMWCLTSMHRRAFSMALSPPIHPWAPAEVFLLFSEPQLAAGNSSSVQEDVRADCLFWLPALGENAGWNHRWDHCGTWMGVCVCWGGGVKC